LVTNPKAGDDGRRCRAWLDGLIAARVQLVVPEGADYEVRRDLFRAGRRGGLDRLDKLGRYPRFLPMTTTAWRRAAEPWAQALCGCQAWFLVYGVRSVRVAAEGETKNRA